MNSQNNFGVAYFAEDGRLTEEFGEKKYNLKEMLKYRKRVGRILTVQETEQFEIKEPILRQA